MAFAGGPLNHFVLQSMVTLAEHLRADPSELGLVTTVSGMLSKPGLAVWSASPPSTDRPPLVEDLGAETVASTELARVVPVAPAAAAATVVSFTVTYGGPDGSDPVRTAVVADLPDGVRTAATCEDASTARLALAEGLIGRDVRVKDTTFSL
jgi:acetyl-CoA C-acetyltransferase